MRKLFSIFILLLVAFNSIGLTFATHYCCGKAVKSKVLIGHSELDCGMNNSQSKIDSTSIIAFCVSSKSCCENVYLSIGTDDTVYKKYKVNFSEFQFIAAFLHIYINIKELKKSQFFVLTDYKPPLWNKDIQVLFQSFLI